jgi:MOSC domain-containing protein YiiM
MEHATASVLESSVDHVRLAPRDVGIVALIVCRPAVNERLVLQEAVLDTESGLVGDGWSTRGRGPNPEAQVTIMNARAIAAIAGTVERWPLAGDQLYVDFDLSIDNLPTGTRLRVGDAIVEVSVKPHTGCEKFRRRFGSDAVRFVNSPIGRSLRLRGVNTHVITSGTVRPGDLVQVDGRG